MNKKVSILIPLYNSEEWIESTIQSIVEQTYQNIELIIVDDGSTDNSFNIAQNFISDKVKIIRQPNQGACAARNKAFEISTGDYINFFDADDIMHHDKIKNQMEIVQKYGDDCIYSCQWLPFETDYQNLTKVKSPIDCSFDDVIDWFKLSWAKNYAAQTGIWLTPRTIIEKTGGWNENLKVNQDGDFFFRVLLNSKEIKFTENAWVYYRREVRNSISKIVMPERANDMLQSYINYEVVLDYKDDYQIRTALVSNYLNFIYIFHPHHPELIKKAWQQINQLNVKVKWVTGGKKFKILGKLIGFKNTLLLRAIAKNLLH